MLTAQQILDEGLLRLEHTKGKPAQVGYDLTLKAVNKVGYRIGANMYGRGEIGKVLKDKTATENYSIKSGFVEVANNKVTVLVEGAAAV